jgi:Spy/CpxP family protein refolding chaperone
MAMMGTRGLAGLSLGIAVALAGAGLARADAQDGSAEGRGGERRGERLARYLGLNEQQQASWKSLHEQHETDMQPMRQEGRDLHQKLRTAMESSNPDPAAVGSAMLALKQHREKVKTAEKAFRGQLEAVLTPDQKSKFEALSAARGYGHGRWGGRGGHGPGGAGRKGGPDESPDNTPDGVVQG